MPLLLPCEGWGREKEDSRSEQEGRGLSPQGNEVDETAGTRWGWAAGARGGGVSTTPGPGSLPQGGTEAGRP